MAKTSTKTSRIVCFCVTAILLALLIALNTAAAMFGDSLSSLLSVSSSTAATRSEGKELALQIQEEGIVMTRNENSTLPLDKTSVQKVNVFGWSSTQWVVAGSGSGRVVGTTDVGTNQNVTDAGITLLEALEQYGIETNAELTDMYTNYLDNRPYWSNGALNSHDYQFCRLYEPSIDDSAYYTPEILDNAKEYSDTALVVLGRVSGESIDCPTVQYKNQYNTSAAVTDDSRTYLDISTEEEALLEYVGQNYENVIVIVNSTNTMNLSFLESIDGLDSCLIVGCTGNYGAEAVPEIIYGDKSPSGRTIDTQVYDFHDTASFATTGSAGVGTYLNSTSYYPGTTTNVNVDDGDKSYPGVSYLDYIEGIYVGYKWFETADEEGYWNGKGGYDSVVQYPFGFGLSYTTFEWTVLEQKVADGEFTVQVRVTNTGSVAGQDVVQLYYTPPYTQGGIEKASVNLCGFAKTHEIQPGSFEDLTISFTLTDMASYDVTDNDGKGAYVLEAGAYDITLRTDAHTVADIRNATYTYDLKYQETITEDPTTGNSIENRFTGEDAVDYGVSLDGSTTGENITYLSRADFEGTFQTVRSANRAMSSKLKELNTTNNKILYSSDQLSEWEAEHADATMPTTGASNNLKLYNSDGTATDLGLQLGADYYDEQWDSVLDQLTVTEMKNLVLHGYTKEQAVSSVGKLETKSLDGPTQVGSFNASSSGVGYPNANVLAQTWNDDLAYDYGLALGKEADEMGVDGLYAPGVNLHRSAFGGRNYEYYSEDSFLSGIMCARTVRGALNAGCYMYIKHFICYEQDSLRDGICCWLTEQTLRETYLSPYKIAIDEGGATAIMSAYGRVGAIWTGGSEALLTCILRDEWDFKGTVITDYSDHHEFMNGDQMLRAGGDLWMDGWTNNGSFKLETTSAAIVTELRRASKNILYTGLNAAYENTAYNEDADTPIITGGTGGKATWWIGVLVAVDVVIVAGCAAWLFFTLRKKPEAAVEEPAAETDSETQSE